MTTERVITTEDIEWNGIKISIRYEANWMNLERADETLPYGHLQLESVAPLREPLPMTSTGYLSHFLHDFDVTDAGGPAAYVLSWLGYAAQEPEWRAYEAAQAQPDLFR